VHKLELDGGPADQAPARSLPRRSELACTLMPEDAGGWFVVLVPSGVALGILTLLGVWLKRKR